MQFQVTPSFTDIARPREISRAKIEQQDYYFAGAGRNDIPYCVFQYTISGKGIFVVNDKEYEMPPGKGFLCDINDPAYIYKMPKNFDEPWEILYVQMLGNAVHKTVNELTAYCGYVYDLPLNHHLVQEWHQYLDNKRNIISASEGMAIVNNLLETLVQTKEKSLATEREHYLITHAQTIIEQEKNRQLSATILAQKLNISREYLSRLFKKHLRKTPYQYIQEYRISNIARQLQYSTCSIKEIAYQNGFCSPEALNVVFKKITGITPGQYRYQKT